MKLFFKIFGIFLVLTGIWLLIQPDAFFGWIENNLESKWLYITAIVFRLIIGTLLLIVATKTKYPTVMRFIGALAIAFAIIFIFIGQTRFQEFIGSILGSLQSFSPISGLLCIVIGIFFIYAFNGNNAVNK